MITGALEKLYDARKTYTDLISALPCVLGFGDPKFEELIEFYRTEVAKLDDEIRKLISLERVDVNHG